MTKQIELTAAHQQAAQDAVHAFIRGLPDGATIHEHAARNATILTAVQVALGAVQGRPPARALIESLKDLYRIPTAESDEEQPSVLVQVGWYCWRCHGIVTQACRSDNVPIHVPSDWEQEMAREISEREEDDSAAEAQGTLNLVRAFVEDMRDWCSPHGMAKDYADRILAVIDGKEAR
jgi:hypothetical protein